MKTPEQKEAFVSELNELFKKFDVGLTYSEEYFPMDWEACKGEFKLDKDSDLEWSKDPVQAELIMLKAENNKLKQELTALRNTHPMIKFLPL